MRVSERIPEVGEKVVVSFVNYDIKATVTHCPCEELKDHSLGWLYSINAYVFWRPILSFDEYQPERLNPENTSNSVCDSLNTTNT